MVYSGTVEAAREGAMRADAVGVAISLDSYARDANYTQTVCIAADVVEDILREKDEMLLEHET